MSDDTSNRGPQDRSRINTSEDYEVEYWTKKFGCTPQQLKDAVTVAGNGADAVEAYLIKNR